MTIVTYLMGEHGVLYALLDRAEELARDADPDRLQGILDLLDEGIRSHAEVEDELLFEPLELATPRAEAAVRGMRTMHDDIAQLLDTLRRAPDGDHGRELLLNLVGLTRQHFFAEEEMVFPLAEQALDPRTLQELGRRYLERRGLLEVHV